MLPSPVNWTDSVGRDHPLGQAKVQQLGHVVMSAALRREDIARLDVAMDETQRVRLAQGVARLLQKINHPLRRQRAHAARPARRCSARADTPSRSKTFHRRCGRSRRSRSCSSAKAATSRGLRVRNVPERLGSLARLGRMTLIATGRFISLMFGQIYLAHAARADELRQAILAELPCLERFAAASGRWCGRPTRLLNAVSDMTSVMPDQAVPGQHSLKRLGNEQCDQVHQHRHSGQNSHDDCRTPPRIGDVHRVHKDQHHPRHARAFGDPDLACDNQVLNFPRRVGRSRGTPIC